MKWMHYRKYAGANSSLVAEDYVPVTELNYYIAEKETAREYCEDWADNVNNNGNYSPRGFTYSWEVVDLPPTDWLTKEIISIGKQREYLSEQIQLYVDTLIKHQK